MPYIDQESRKRLEDEKEYPITEGECNYRFYTWMLKEWKEEPRYKTIHKIKKQVNLIIKTLKRIHPEGNEIIAIELAFMEFYRRVVSKYEDAAIVKNGDIEV